MDRSRDPGPWCRRIPRCTGTVSPALPLALVAALLVAAAPRPGRAAEWDGGGLPPAIAKPRPSASVPADLPGSRVDPCRLLDGIRVYRRVAPGTYVGVSPPNTTDCGTDASPPAASPAMGPEGSGLPFDED